MLLTPEWKKTIIPLIIESIFIYYSEIKFRQDISTTASWLGPPKKGTSSSGIHYLGVFYKGTYAGESYNEISSRDSIFPYFKNILDKWNTYQNLVSETKHYLSVGMAMCHTVDCVCEVFPSIIIDAIASYSKTVQFVPKPTENPKFLKFIENNKHIESSIRTQLVLNLLAPEQQDAVFKSKLTSNQ